MILADENIHSYIIRALPDAGFDVISVLESSKSIKDEQVIQLAVQHNYLLFTEDKDFGEWVFAHHDKDLSVLLLRYAYYDYQEIGGALIICQKPITFSVHSSLQLLRKKLECGNCS